jgi:hypothetical protein
VESCELVRKWKEGRYNYSMFNQEMQTFTVNHLPIFADGWFLIMQEYTAQSLFGSAIRSQPQCAGNINVKFLIR